MKFWATIGVAAVALSWFDMAYQIHAGATGRELTPRNGFLYTLTYELYARPAQIGDE